MNPISPYAYDSIVSWAKRVGKDPGPLLGRLSDFAALSGSSKYTLTDWDELIDQVKEEIYPAATQERKEPPPDLWSYDEQGRPRPNKWAFVRTLRLMENFATLTDTAEVLHHHDGIYNGHAERFVDRWIEVQFDLKNSIATEHFKREALGSLKALTYIDRSELNPPGWLCLANGLLDLRSPSNPCFQDGFDPSVRLTYKLPVRFDATATCPLFLEFLERAVPGEAERAHIQEFVGYLLLPGNAYKLAFFIVGPRNTGKSTFLEIVRGLLGRKNTATIALQSLAENRFASAALYGKLANIYADLSPRLIKDAGLFKMLTGGSDEVPAERKFEAPFSFVNTAKLLFSANAMPSVPWGDDAFFDRWSVITFDQMVPVSDRVPFYERKILDSEASGILNWALEGLSRLDRRGRFDLGGSVTKTREVWKRLSDSLAWFVSERLERCKGEHIVKSDLYTAYTTFCEDNAVEARTQVDVGRELPQLLPGVHAAFAKIGGKMFRVWTPVRLKIGGQTSDFAREDVRQDTLDTADTGPPGISRNGQNHTIPEAPVSHVSPVSEDPVMEERDNWTVEQSEREGGG